jgi:hypothetical protein
MNTSGDEISILAELRAISEGAAANSRFDKNKSTTCNTSNTGESKLCSNDFLGSNPENSNFNQYWYSDATIQTLVEGISEILGKCSGSKVAFLSTPSLYFALPDQERKQCKLFEYDGVWSNDAGYVQYDFNEPDCIDSTLQKTFDLVVIDPPFITKDVWEKYAMTAKLLLKYDPFGRDSDAHIKKKGLFLGTTVSENADFLKEELNAEPAVFQPVIPNLVYQYNVYTNFPENCNALNIQNPEIRTDSSDDKLEGESHE